MCRIGGKCAGFRAKPVGISGHLPASPVVKVDRDQGRVRQRYMQLSKEELVERLLSLEQQHAQLHERWLVQQDEVLTWRLHAQAVEARLKKE